MRPQRAIALLAPLAAQPHLIGPVKLAIGGAQVEELLDASAVVEQREGECMGSAPDGRAGVGRLEHGAQLAGLQVVDDAGRCALEGYREQTLAGYEPFGMLRGDVARNRVNSGETRVACGGDVSPLLLKVIEKGDDDIRVEIEKIELDDRPCR